MQHNLTDTSKRSVHQRYRQLLVAGFTPQESSALIALAAGIAGHAEGVVPAATTWRWQEISRIEFLAYLARSRQVGGPDDGNHNDAQRSGRVG